MASVQFASATRLYPGTHQPAVSHLDLEIHDGELLVLVGPSGSGKSTALRMLAGLEPLDEGAVFIGDRDVSGVRPRDRDIAMVFQNYALYPQLTVAENMGFALKQQKVPKEERTRTGARSGARARSRALPRSQAEEPVRRPAPARRHGPGDRAQAAGVPDGRAALEPGRQAAGADPDRARRAPGPARRDDGVRHPRPGRGDDDGPPRRRPARRAPPAMRHAARALPRAGEPVRGRLHRVAGDEPVPVRHRMRAVRVGGRSLDLDAEMASRLASFGGDRVVVGFRPEAVHVGDGPLAAHIRTVEDLGSEAFVHVAFDHEGETVSAVSKMPAPFKGETGDNIDVQVGRNRASVRSRWGADRHRDRSTSRRSVCDVGDRATDRPDHRRRRRHRAGHGAPARPARVVACAGRPPERVRGAGRDPTASARPLGAAAWVDTFDVTDADGVERSVRACRDAIGVPTALFNNAGYQGAFERIDRYPHVDARARVRGQRARRVHRAVGRERGDGRSRRGRIDRVLGIDGRRQRRPQHVGLLGVEGGHHRADQERRQGPRARRHPCERGVAGLHRTGTHVGQPGGVPGRSAQSLLRRRSSRGRPPDDPHGAAAAATAPPTRSHGSLRSCCPTMPRTSPASTSRSPVAPPSTGCVDPQALVERNST